MVAPGGQAVSARVKPSLLSADTVQEGPGWWQKDQFPMNVAQKSIHGAGGEVQHPVGSVPTYHFSRLR